MEAKRVIVDVVGGGRMVLNHRFVVVEPKPFDPAHLVPRRTSSPKRHTDVIPSSAVGSDHVQRDAVAASEKRAAIGTTRAVQSHSFRSFVGSTPHLVSLLKSDLAPLT